MSTTWRRPRLIFADVTITAHRSPLAVSPPGAPLPIAIGPANAELVTGVGWRYLRDRFPELVRHIGERKSVILARDLEAALAGRSPIDAVRDAEPDPVEAACREFGLIDP